MFRIKQFLTGTVFLAIVASLLWSSAFAGIKIGLKYHTVIQFAGLRFTLSGLLLILYFNNFRYYLSEVVRHWKLIMVLALLQTVFQYVLFYQGISLLPASIAAMITGSAPLFVSIVAHFSMRDDKMHLTKAISIMVGIAGVVVISLGRDRLSEGGAVSLAGIFMLVGSSILSGLSNVFVAKRLRNVSPVVLSSSSLFFGGIALLAVSLPLEGIGLRAVSVEYFLALGWLSFLSAAAFAIWYTLLQRRGVKVSELNMWKFLVPVAGAILSWAVIPGDHPDLISVAGMIIIATSLLLHNHSTHTKNHQNRTTGHL